MVAKQQAEQTNTADQFTTLLSKHFNKLKSLDDSWHLENALGAMLSGKSAIARVIASILAVLPTPTREVTTQAALDALLKIEANSSWKLAPVEAKQALTNTLKQLRLLFTEAPLTIDVRLQSTEMKDIWARMAYFLRWKQSATSQVCTGGDGYDTMLAFYVSKPGKIDVKAARFLIQFSHLCKVEQSTGMWALVKDHKAESEKAAAQKAKVAKASGGASSSGDLAKKKSVDLFSR